VPSPALPRGIPVVGLLKASPVLFAVVSWYLTALQLLTVRTDVLPMQEFGGILMIAIFPEIAASAVAGDVEKLAILVRRYFGGAQTYVPRPNIAMLVEGAGLSLRRIALPSEGALLAKDERGAFTIVMVVNQGLEASAARFLQAHLLGHYLLDVQPLIARGDWAVSGYQEPHCALTRYSNAASLTLTTRQHDARELRADAFAAALLMPRGMVTRAMETLQDQAKVAQFFGVNRACLHRRLIDIGLVSNEPVNFLDAEVQASGGTLPGLRVDDYQMAGARDGESSASQLVPPEGAMPRAYAASTYGTTEKMTRHRTPSPVPVVTPSAAASRVGEAPHEAAGAIAASGTLVDQPISVGQPPVRSSLKGMERLRELARKLDKGIPPQR